VTQDTGGGTLTIPEAPGFSLTFSPGQVTFPGGSKTGCVSVTVVHGDKVPMVPGFGQQPRFIVTIQPSGAVFTPAAAITLPNVDGLAPRAVTEMYSYDHDISSFVAIGTGLVSEDGFVIRSSPGVGVIKAGWHCGGDPRAIGTPADCGQCKWCQDPTGGGRPGGSCVLDPKKDLKQCGDSERTLSLFCGPTPTPVHIENVYPRFCNEGECRESQCDVSAIGRAIVRGFNTLCNSSCVPDDLRSVLTSRLARLTVIQAQCAFSNPNEPFPSTVCGEVTSSGDAIGSDILFTPNTWSPGCTADGSGAETAFHELLHILTGRSHGASIDIDTDIVYGCEKACFPASVGNSSACSLANLLGLAGGSVRRHEEQ
jgi:hypothetical protein